MEQVQQQPDHIIKRKPMMEEEDEEIIMSGKHRQTKVLIPDHMFDDILLNLPVKSLLRFTCVSEQYHSIISSKRFIADYTRRYNHININPNRFSLFFQLKRYRYFNESLFCTPTITMVNYDSLERLENHEEQRQDIVLEASSKRINLPSPVLDGFQITCCCDGIMCVLSLFDHLGLWNPVTNEYRAIPSPDPMTFKHASFGFGYDFTTGDYKVVSVPCYYTSSKLLDSKSLVYVMALGSSSWRKIIDGFQYVVLPKQQAIYAADDGSVYWLARKPRLRNGAIVMIAFDLAKESFREVPLPSSVDQEIALDFGLGVVQGRISLSSYDIHNNCFDIFMLKGGGGGVNWVKFTRFPLGVYKGPGRIQSLKPLFTTNKGSLIMYAFLTYPKSVIRFRGLIYDPKEGTCKKFQVAHLPEWEKVEVIKNTETLVSVSSLHANS